MTFCAAALALLLPLSQSGTGTFLVLRVDSQQKDVVSQVQDVVKRRLEGMGIPNPVVTPHQGTADQLYVLLPAGTDVTRAKRLILSTAKLEFKLVEDGPTRNRQVLLEPHGDQVPTGMDVLQGLPGVRGDSSPSYYLVRQTTILSNSDIKDARPVRDEVDLPAVDITLTAEAVAKFSRATGDNVGRQLAIILDGVVQSAPRINGAVTRPDVRITGLFKPQEVVDLALALRTAALPVPVTVIAEGVAK